MSLSILLNEIARVGLHPQQIFRPVIFSNRLLEKIGKENISVDKDGFEVKVDVKDFQPTELTVKTVGDSVTIEGKHESADEDNGYISQHFWRQYRLPKGYDPKKISTTLAEGILTVTAPPPPADALEADKERIVEIKQLDEKKK